MKILVVGGYGTFGGRLVDLLKDEPRLTLMVAGRSPGRATAFCAARPAASARLEPVTFDRDGDVAGQLRALAPDLLVDASGPFQAYGAAAYRLVEACIAAQITYLDLADGSDFVAGVSAFDAKARAAGIAVLSGVSSFPVLTAAVVRRLAADLQRIGTIRGGIAPSPYAGVGENVVRAIASYAGQPVMRRRPGQSAGHPFTEQLRYTIAPPGCLPLRNTLFSLVDVPDLQALAALWPDVEDVWMGAGPVPEVLHRLLIALSWLVRWRLLPSLSWLSRCMYVVMNWVRWGEHRGGMFVTLTGVDRQARSVSRAWHLLAEGDDGPLIPSMAIEALVRRTLDGNAPVAGARAATQELELADYERLFAHRRITTGVRNVDTDDGLPLFARLLATAWTRVPAAVRALHEVTSASRAQGRCHVERGPNPLARVIATLCGFPPAGEAVPISVQFMPVNGTERWRRQFGGHTFESSLAAGRGRAECLLVERIGVLAFAQALVLDDARLHFVLRRWSLWGVPLPLWLAPRSRSHESEQQGRFHFHVEISHPWVGLIVRYRGWLEPA